MKFTSAAVLVGLLALGLFVVSGCQQQAEQAQTAADETAEVAADMATDAAETAGDMADEAGEMAKDAGDMGQSAAQLAADGKALDPVCGMVVEMEGAPTVEHEGVTFYFCSDSCAAKFQKDAAKYLPGS